VSTLNLTAQHQVTLNLGLPGFVSSQYAAGAPWAAGANGWTVVSGTGTVSSTSSEGVTVTTTSSTPLVIRRTVVTSANNRRARFRVQLSDPESRPVQVQLTTPLGTARMVSGVPVWLEAIGAGTPTTVDITVTRPAGAASASVLIVQADVSLEGVGSHSWTLDRTDSNGTNRVAAGYLPGSLVGGDYPQMGLRAPANTGGLTFVDRECSLSGNVQYTFDSIAAGSVEVLNTGASGVLSSGAGVLHRVNAATPTLHQVQVVAFRAANRNPVQPVSVLGTGLPVMPIQPLSSRQGSMLLYFTSADAGQLVVDDLITGEVHQLRQDVDGRTAMDAYFVASAVELDCVMPELQVPVWAVRLDFTETARGIAT
jgi:hypothetical protein